MNIVICVNVMFVKLLYKIAHTQDEWTKDHTIMIASLNSLVFNNEWNLIG